MRTPRVTPVVGRVGLLVLTVPLLVTACSADRPIPAPTVTTTVTITAHPTPSPEPDGDDQVMPFEPWREAVYAFGQSDDSGEPIEERYLAVIKHATYDEQGESLTLTLDEVAWNPRYEDGNAEEPILNPTVSWKTVTVDWAIVLVDAGNGFQHLRRAEFPAFIAEDDARATSEDGVGWRTPFGVWFIGNEPVAIIERYVP